MAPLAGDARSVLKGTWSLAAVAIVVMVLRVVAKLKLRHVGIDDCAMITALVRTSSQESYGGYNSTNRFG